MGTRRARPRRCSTTPLQERASVFSCGWHITLDSPRRLLVEAQGARDFGVVCRSRDDRHAPLERVELADAFLAAHADDLVAAIERVLHHVAPELARRSDDTDFH